MKKVLRKRSRSDHILSLLSENSKQNEEAEKISDHQPDTSSTDEAQATKRNLISSNQIIQKPQITHSTKHKLQCQLLASEVTAPSRGLISSPYKYISSENDDPSSTILTPEQQIMPMIITPYNPAVHLPFDVETPKQFTELNCVELNAFEFENPMNYVGGSAPPSVLPQLYDMDLDGPRSAGLPLQNAQELDFAIPSITSDDFNFYHPRPPSSTLEEPSSTDDYRDITLSETSWIPDSEEECTPRKLSYKYPCRITDSDATSVSSSVIDESISPSEAAHTSPSLITNVEISAVTSSALNAVSSSTHGFNDTQPSSSTHDLSNSQTSATLNDSASRRWKKSVPTKWKKNLSKSNKHSCKSYLNAKGLMMPAKKPKAVNCEERNCRFRCTELTEDDRMNICKGYWSLKDYKDQKQFILRHAKQQIPSRHSNNVITKNRTFSRIYHFYKDNEEIRVCRTFFMATLNISNGPINKAFDNCDEYGEFVGNDNRGKKSPSNKCNTEDLKFLRDHIESFPTMESHYCRKSSKRLYLDQKLSISKMYQMYKKTCSAQDKTPLSQSKYRTVFGTEYNYSFFVPKKDQCSICFKYKKDWTKYQNIYNEHINRKTSAAEAKRQDKERSLSDATFLTVTADLQSVLQIPSGDVGELYYTRKLCVYNFTIYESKPPNKGFCFMWNETNGKRGSSEIATCLFKWTKMIPETIKEVSIYSDTCSGQNRNQFVAAFLLNLVQLSHLDVIEQKYLESGHTMMEVDSMHSAIESEKKRTSIFSMHDWKNVAKRARSTRHRKDAPPYEVIELKYNEILDTKKLAKKIIKNKTIAQDGKKVQWLKVKRLRYEKCNPGLIKFSYGYDGEYTILDTRKKTRNNKADSCTTSSEMELPKAYSSSLKISHAKKKDLLNLCRTDIIPVEFHPWFESLAAIEKPDKLPEPDALEESDIEDF